MDVVCFDVKVNKIMLQRNALFHKMHKAALNLVFVSMLCLSAHHVHEHFQENGTSRYH